MTRRSRELELQGIDVINLSIGQPDFDTPEFIKDAAKEGMDQGYTGYTPVAGYLELRKAICHKLERDNGLVYTPDQIVVSTGAKQSLVNAMLSLVNPGDEVIVPAPYWVSYKEMVKLAEGKAIVIQGSLENDFKVTPDQVRAAITPRSRIFIFSSPCNPTGSVYTRDELYALAMVLKDFPDVYIISDEIYELINFSGKHESIAQFDFIRERVILINGLSKGFAMTGWRLGYMAADKEIAKACDKIQGQITSGASSISQRAAIRAMEVDPATSTEVIAMREEFLQRRNLLLELMETLPGLKTYTPEGAFYLFPNVTSYFGKSNGDCTISNATDLCMYLLDKAHVALVPGDAFGCSSCLRFSYATSRDKIRESVRRIREALALLK